MTLNKISDLAKGVSFARPVPSVVLPLTRPFHASIETVRFRLVPLFAEMVSERYVGWLNDPDVVEYLDSRYMPQDMDTVRSFVGGIDHRRNFIWGIFDHTGIHIGNCTMFVDWVNSVAELGVLVGEKEFWGRNIVFEVYTSLILLSFFHFDLYKIWAKTRGSNHRAAWNLRKLGMRLEAELPNHLIYGARRTSLLFYGIGREEWVSRHGVTPIQQP